MGTTHYARTVEIVIDQRKTQGDLQLICIKPRFVEGYIIPFECSFQTSSRENEHSRQLMPATRQQFCGDTINTFKHDAISFVRRQVGAFNKSSILNHSSSSPPPSHFFLNMQLVSFNGNNSLRTNPGDCH